MTSDRIAIPEVKQAEVEADIERLNEFFNSKEVKEELHWFTYRETLERAFKRDDRRLYYTENQSNNDVNGALMVWCESRILDNDESQIRLIAVKPDKRRQGLGSALCDKAEKFARSKNKSMMIAEVAANNPAVTFWESLGYSKTDTRRTDGDRKMHRVEKSI